MIPHAEQFLARYHDIDNRIQGPAINHLFSDASIVERTFEGAGLPTSLRNVDIFLALYRSALRKRILRNRRLVELFDGLHKRGLKLGVVTDGTTAEQTEQLACLGILERIDACVTSEALGLEKPNAAMFLGALEALDCKEPGLAVMIGNDLARDILGAQQAGLKTVLVTEFHVVAAPGVFPDRMVSSVYETSTLLRKWHDNK